MARKQSKTDNDISEAIKEVSEQHATPTAATATASTGEEPTSRLCVKNLPKYITDTKLKEHFSAKGEVTDVKVLKTRDGQSRQMGFIGFKTTEDAAAALRYFDRTFIDATRISVEYARKYKDPTLSRPWSKHSEGSSAHVKKGGGSSAGTKEGGEVDGSMAEATALAAKLKLRAGKQGGKAGKGQGGGGEEDPKLAEFLALMAPRSRAKLWANDDVAPVQTLEDLLGKKGDAEEETAAAEKEQQALLGGGESDEEYEDLPGGRGASASAGFGRAGGDGSDDEGQGVNSDDDDGEDGEDGQDGDEGAAGQAPALRGKDTAVVSEAVSDLDYLKSRMKKWDDNDDDDDVEREDEQDMDKQAGVAGPSKPTSKLSGQAGRSGMEVDGEEEEGEEEEEEEEGGGVKGRAEGGAGAGRGGPMEVDGSGAGEDAEATIRDTGRLFVRNLAYTASEADLAELFGRCGDVSGVHVVLDRETKKSKGIAYVLYVVPEDALHAYRELDGTIFQGRLIHILPAKKPPSTPNANGTVEEAGGQAGGAGTSSFKVTREAQRKADAGNRAAWNTLFMRPDTVADAVAAHYGLSKAELMDARGASDVAVRMALGEAAVIAQTKAALADAGIDVSALEAAAAAAGRASATKAVARSATALLVKNLPFAASEDELRELFGRSGPLARLVLPPSHALALVEYCEPQDARTAFKALAYKKYQHVPLYLEWAPKDVFSGPPPSAKAQPAAVKADKTQAGGKGLDAEGAAGGQADAAGPDAKAAAKQAKAALKDQLTEAGAGADGGEDDDEAAQGGSIYVKNISFATTDSELQRHFDKAVSAAGGLLLSARVTRRKGPGGELLSAGFGFVEVSSPEVAAAVIKALQGSMLGNHKLSLQLSKRKAGAGAGAAKGAGKDKAVAKACSKDVSTKLVVRNVAFEATRKDIAALFAPFGHLRSCRLPKKFDGSHRGFAFVEYTTKQEARNAIEGVGGTHLYGRRLVVEYAKEDEGLDELRAKTAAKYRGEETLADLDAAPPSKRMKKNL